MIGKTDQELEDMLYKTVDGKGRIDHNLRGMSYAEGVIASLEWVLGQRSDAPVDDSDCS